VLLGAEPNKAQIDAKAKAFNDWKKLPDAPPGDAANKYARTNLIWVLLNHNDFVMLR
jgi:hypothetical protein